MSRARDNANTSIFGAPSVTLGSDATGDVYYRAAGGALTRLATGADGTVLTSTGAGAVPAFEATVAGGITESDTWRINATFTGNADPIASNWERDDTYGFGLNGTGMTQSSGIFSFPSTGYWLVSYYARFHHGGDNRYANYTIMVTTNNSDYSHASRGSGFIQETSGTTTVSGCSCCKMLDVTDITNVKVRFIVTHANTSTTTGAHTSENETYTTFLKLGDT